MEHQKETTSSAPYVTVVIGTLNRPRVVQQLIKQLKGIAKKIPLQIIVVDQSTQENYVMLADTFPKAPSFMLVHFDRPNTCNYLNFGWQQAQAPIVLYLDDDVTITDETIPAHLDAYLQPSVQAVAGRVINDNEPIVTIGQPSATPEVDNRLYVAPPIQVGHILWCGAEFTKNFTYEYSTYVDFPYGCNMSFRKNALNAIGGFDERLSPPIYAFNEVDIGVRLNQRFPHSFLFVPNALVYHHQAPHGGTRNDFEVATIKRSNNFNYGYFLGKNFNWLQNIVCFARRLPYQVTKDSRSTKDILAGFKAGKQIGSKV